MTSDISSLCTGTLKSEFTTNQQLTFWNTLVPCKFPSHVNLRHVSNCYEGISLTDMMYSLCCTFNRGPWLLDFLTSRSKPAGHVVARYLLTRANVDLRYRRFYQGSQQKRLIILSIVQIANVASKLFHPMPSPLLIQ